MRLTSLKLGRFSRQGELSRPPSVLIAQVSVLTGRPGRTRATCGRRVGIIPVETARCYQYRLGDQHINGLILLVDHYYHGLI